MLQEVMTLDMMEVANTLVKLYLGQNKIRQYLDVICTEEIENTGILVYCVVLLVSLVPLSEWRGLGSLAIFLSSF